MISALPLILARKIAQAVDSVGADDTAFGHACRALSGPPIFAGRNAKNAAVFVRAGALEQDHEIGATPQGTLIRLPFSATVQIWLAGPADVTPDLEGLTPTDAVFDGSDLMLSLAMDLFRSDADPGQKAPLSVAETIVNNRRLRAEWRFVRVEMIRPKVVAKRTLWALAVKLEGQQTLSPVPAEGGHIREVRIAGQVQEEKPFDALITGGALTLPLTIFTGISEAMGARLLGFDLEQLGDLRKISTVEINGLANTIAAGDSAFTNAILRLHNLASTLVAQAGLNAAHLSDTYARLMVSEVWDGTTLKLPDNIRESEKLRVESFAMLVIEQLRPDTFAHITLGQVSRTGEETIQ